jgi:predicted phage terminase large subunit-like protein
LPSTLLGLPINQEIVRRRIEANKEKIPGPQAGPQELFLKSKADIAIYGGAAGGGKTWALLIEPLSHIDNPGFGGVIFRRTTVQVRNEGGLWDESVKMYPLVGGDPKEASLWWKFPKGSSISFAHLEYEKNTLDWQGAQIPFIGFDELTHFTEKQFWYLMSRNRSMCGVKPYIRATCNPDADSWVAKFIAWWIDQETGLAIPERGGVLRWFVRIDDQLIWGDSAAELEAANPGAIAKSVTFVPASLADNQALAATDQGYLANLMALPLVERERLLKGNWKIRATAGTFFQRGWFEFVSAVPANARRCRGWDMAATKAKVNKPKSAQPDATAGVKLAYAAKVFYVEHCEHLRGSAGEVKSTILSRAATDGTACTVRLAQDPGQAGKDQAETYIKALAGYPVVAKPISGEKTVRAKPASAQSEVGNVKIVRTGDPTKDAWIEPFLDEICAFPGGVNDDRVDAFADALNELALGSSYTLENV